MALLKTLLSVLVLSLVPLVTVEAAVQDVGTIIERFVQHRFPSSHEHFWVINQATVEEDEVTVDVSTVVRMPRREAPIAERFLLLIVNGELAAAQLVPSEGEADCQPEET